MKEALDLSFDRLLIMITKKTTASRLSDDPRGCVGVSDAVRVGVEHEEG